MTVRIGITGAAGRMGRLVVSKLVDDGFRVAVLVRSLSTETLDLLGSGVSYSYGDMTDYRTLLDAMEDVDRVIFAAEGDDELTGLSQVMRSFQDTRTFMYGVGALGAKGGDHTMTMLKRQLQQVMEQIACERISDFPKHLVKNA